MGRSLAIVDSDTTRKRSQDSSLRQRQQELTRRSIVFAARDLILEGRIHNFTIQEVADRAGVAPRTVYLHFSSREAILEGLVHWSAELTAERNPPYPDRLEDLPAWVEVAIPSLISFLPAAKALYTVLGSVYDKEVPAASRERDELFARLVEEAAAGLSEAEKKAATASLRLWVSMRTWLELQSRYGLDEEELTLAVVDGVKAQIERLRQRVEEVEAQGAERDGE